MLPGETILSASSFPTNPDNAPFIVMRSAAGYYIGTERYDEECDCITPYSRESEYFQVEAQAVKALESWVPGGMCRGARGDASIREEWIYGKEAR